MAGRAIYDTRLDSMWLHYLAGFCCWVVNDLLSATGIEKARARIVPELANYNPSRRFRSM